MLKPILILLYLACEISTCYSQKINWIPFEDISINKIKDDTSQYYFLLKNKNITNIGIIDTTLIISNYINSFYKIKFINPHNYTDTLIESSNIMLYESSGKLNIISYNYKIYDNKIDLSIYEFDPLKYKINKQFKSDSIIFKLNYKTTCFGIKNNETEITSLYILNLLTKDIEKLSVLDLHPEADPISFFSYMHTNKSLLLKCALPSDGGIESLQFYMYYIGKNKLENVTSFLNSIFRNYYPVEYDSNYFDLIEELMIYQYERIYLQGYSNISPVLNENLKVIYEMPTFYPEIYGPVIQNDTLSALLYLARTENQESYVIPFDFSPSFEKSMGLVYKDQVLDKELLTGFDKVKLSVLKNLVFARHNYGFKNPYYQAFFNLFAFYHNTASAKSRRSDVSGLLTETDNKNLEIINMQMLKIK